jgi:hypothetical protein
LAKLEILLSPFKTKGDGSDERFNPIPVNEIIKDANRLPSLKEECIFGQKASGRYKQ